jgi:hypothetical protein
MWWGTQISGEKVAASIPDPLAPYSLTIFGFVGTRAGVAKTILPTTNALPNIFPRWRGRGGGIPARFRVNIGVFSLLSPFPQCISPISMAGDGL